jgi:hypothetical protein
MTSFLYNPEGLESIGLIGDYRKFNVAVTRGMALCIVVGEPYTLYSDPPFRTYMETCDRNHRYFGADCSLLSRNTEKDAEGLLNNAAQIAFRDENLLGRGSAKAFNDNQYFSDEITWRTLL